MKHFISIIFASLLIFNVAGAHVAGTLFEENVGDYLLDIGAQQEEIRAGEKTDFDFALFKNEINEKYDDVFVEFTKDGKIVFSSRLQNPKIGRTTLKIVFPEGGDYKMSASFLKDEKTIVEHTYDVKVAAKAGAEEQTESSSSSTSGIILGAVIGLIVGIILVSLLRRKA